MYPITIEEIDQLTLTDLGGLVSLDKQGVLIAPGEDLDSFKKRLLKAKATEERISSELDKDGKSELYPGYWVYDEFKIPKTKLQRVSSKTSQPFAFKIDWVPAFYAKKSMGILWGGCAITFPEDEYAVFIIRREFKNKQTWLIYSRDELLAHELCHIARAPINDTPFEEHFAYSVSKSRLRKAIGNCFQQEIDALMFILPIFLLLGVQIYQLISGSCFSLIPFYLFAVIPPMFLLLRNFYLKNIFNKAKKKLLSAGITRADAILFRCNGSEIKDFSKLDKDSVLGYLEASKEKDLRWEIIYKRFVDKSKV
jgi:hypothetical protein